MEYTVGGAFKEFRLHLRVLEMMRYADAGENSWMKLANVRFRCRTTIRSSAKHMVGYRNSGLAVTWHGQSCTNFLPALAS